MKFDIVTIDYDGYKAKLDKFIQENPGKKPFLTVDIDPSEIEEFIVVYGLNAGLYIKKDGELGGLFNGSDISGIGSELVEKAVRRGADHLNCFDGKLVDYYMDLGFSEVNRIEWDDEYAPEGWDYGKFGKPDVVIMEV